MITLSQVQEILDKNEYSVGTTAFGGQSYIRIDLAALKPETKRRIEEDEKYALIQSAHEALTKANVVHERRMSMPVIQEDDKYKKGAFRTWPHILIPTGTSGGGSAATAEVHSLREEVAALARQQAAFLEAFAAMANPELAAKLKAAQQAEAPKVENEAPKAEEPDFQDYEVVVPDTKAKNKAKK